MTDQIHVDTASASLIGQPDFDPAHHNGNSLGRNISPALQTTFLPHRKDTSVDLANKDVCNCKPKAFTIGPLPILKKLDLMEKVNLIEEKIPDLRSPQILSLNRQSLTPLAKNSLALDSSELERVRTVEALQIDALKQAGIEAAQQKLEPSPVVLSTKKIIYHPSAGA